MRLFSLGVVSLAASLAACSSAKPAMKAEPAPQKVEAPPPEPTPEPSKVTAVSDDKAEGAAELAAALRDLQNVSVFFKLDDDGLSGEAKDKLAAVGRLLGKYGQLKVRIEGNCDERGTPEHNLALGQRRAEAARRYLATMGARQEQMQAVSLGKEHPKALGHDEQAWQQNRRDDIIAVQTHE